MRGYVFVHRLEDLGVQQRPSTVCTEGWRPGRQPESASAMHLAKGSLRVGFREFRMLVVAVLTAATQLHGESELELIPTLSRYSVSAGGRFR